MKSKNLIEEKLLGNHKDFLKYCQESRKIFVEDLDREDFIAYRSEYAVSHEDIEELKNLLNFQEQFSPPQNVFDDSEVILQDYFKITDLAPYENISIDNFNFSSRIKKLLKQNNCRTLAELLKHSIKSLSQLSYFGKVYVEIIFETLKSFFETQEKTFTDSQQITLHEEVSQSLESILDEYEGTLQKYFNISDLTPYENIYIADLDFSVRVKNCLRGNGYRTLADLLKLSRQTLSNLRNLGQNSIDNILKTLKFFFDTYDFIGTNSTEIQPLKKKTLQEIFNIVYLPAYENILITDLNFDNHVKNYLVRNNCKTLADLLKLSELDLLSGFGYFGNNSFDNILNTLKELFDSRRKKIPVKILQRANEELDEFLRNAALNHSPQIDLIIAAFEKFSDLVTIKSAFRNLPEEFRDKRVRLFFLACGLKKNNFFVDLPDDLTLSELPEYLSENNFDFDVDELKKFADELNFDVRVATKKMLTNLFENERGFEIVRRRAEGATLEQVGKEFGVTRERIRQIEAKPARKFRHPKNGAKKIFYFIHALTNGDMTFTLNDAKNFLDDKDAEMIWFFVIKALKDGENLGTKKFNYDKESDTEIFNYDKESNAFVFHHGAVLDEDMLIKNLPDIMKETSFEETIINLANEKNCSVDLIKVKLSKIYKRSGKFFHRERLTLKFKCEYILKERFPNGYKIGDENYYSRFIRYLQEIFDEKTTLTQRALDALISKIGFLCDRGKYIHPDFVHVPSEIIERVENFIDASARTAIFYKEIFETLRDFFVNTQVMNHYFLQGAIKFHNLPYTLRKDYLTKSDEIDMGKEFDNFVAERGEVSTQEIKENFVSFKDFNIAFLVGRCPEIIRIGDGILIHATHLNLYEEDFEPIKNFLRQNCSTPINSRILFDLFFERFADFMTRNEIQNHNKLFGILQYMFRDEFNFARPYISMEDIKNVSNKKILLRILEDVDEIEIEDLVGICEENGIHYVARTYLIDSLRPDFVRVDEFTLMRPESIGVTDEIISAVVESIQSAIGQNGGWQSARTFEDYEWLPQLEISWNSFLLESVATLAEDVLYKIKVPSTSTNFSLAIFVAEEFAEDDYQSFLTKILIAEHNKEPFRTEKEIFDWLKMQGLCNKRLPKFLQEGRAFEILGE